MCVFSEKRILISLGEYPDDFSPSHKRILSARNIPPNEIDKSLKNIKDFSNNLYLKEVSKKISSYIDSKSNIFLVSDSSIESVCALSVLKDILGNFTKIKIIDEDDIAYYSNEYSLFGNYLIITLGELKNLSTQNINLINLSIKNPTFFEEEFSLPVLILYILINLKKDFTSINIKSYLDIIAIGILSAGVRLNYNNRILVYQGIKNIKRGGSRKGIYSLLGLNNKNIGDINSCYISDFIIPKLDVGIKIFGCKFITRLLLTNVKSLASSYSDILIKNYREHDKKTRLTINTLERKIFITVKNSYEPRVIKKGIWLEENINTELMIFFSKNIYRRFNFPIYMFNINNCSLKIILPHRILNLDVISAFFEKRGFIISKINRYEYITEFLFCDKGIEKLSASINLNLVNGFYKKDNLIDTDGMLMNHEIHIDNAIFLNRFEVWGNGVPEPIFLNRFWLEPISNIKGSHLKVRLKNLKNYNTFNAVYDIYNEEPIRNILSNTRIGEGVYDVLYKMSYKNVQERKLLELKIKYIKKIN